MTTAMATTSVAPYGVNLINKNDAWRLFFGLLKHVANARGTHPHKHLHEVGAGNGEKRYFGLTGYRFGEEGFTGSRWADHQHAARNLSTQTLKFSGIA